MCSSWRLQEAARRFAPKGGNLINISSIVSTPAPANASVYSATKRAADAVTKSLAKELGPRNIRVNAVRPSLGETEGTNATRMITGDMQKQVELRTPLGRKGQPQNIAPAMVFLASSDNASLTGETLLIAGGNC